MGAYDIALLVLLTIISELGDKSHLIALILGAKYKEHLKVFGGVMLAFLLSIGLGLVVGRSLSQFITPGSLTLIAGFTFVVFGLYTFFSHSEGAIKIGKHSAFISAFVLVFIAEIGDKSQALTVYYAMKENLLVLFVGLLGGLSIITYATIFVGKTFNKLIKEKTMHACAGWLFIGLGVLTLLGI